MSSLAPTRTRSRKPSSSTSRRRRLRACVIRRPCASLARRRRPGSCHLRAAPQGALQQRVGSAANAARPRRVRIRRALYAIRLGLLPTCDYASRRRSDSSVVSSYPSADAARPARGEPVHHAYKCQEKRIHMPEATIESQPLPGEAGAYARMAPHAPAISPRRCARPRTAHRADGRRAGCGPESRDTSPR